MKFLFFLAFNFIFIVVSFSQRLEFISFKDIQPKETCDGKYVNYRLILDVFGEKCNDDNCVNIQYLGSNVPNLKFLYNGNVIEELSSFTLNKSTDLNNISVRFKIDRSIKEPHITLIQTQKELKREGKIKIEYGFFYVNSKNPEILISNSCQDSIILLFPFEGTQTDIYLSVLEDGEYVQKKPFTFYCCNGNKLKIPITRLTKFKVWSSGCNNNSNYEFETK